MGPLRKQKNSPAHAGEFFCAQTPKSLRQRPTAWLETGDFRWRVAGTGSGPPGFSACRRRGPWKSRSLSGLGKPVQFATFPAQICLIQESQSMPGSPYRYSRILSMVRPMSFAIRRNRSGEMSRPEWKGTVCLFHRDAGIAYESHVAGPRQHRDASKLQPLRAV